MNTCEVSGWIQGAPELRITRDGVRILNFEIAVDGDHEPYVPIGFIIRGDGTPDLHAGMKVFVHGALMHHHTRGLVIAATKIRAIANEIRPEAFRA
jgi:hypothetical protein